MENISKCVLLFPVFGGIMTVNIHKRYATYIFYLFDNKEVSRFAFENKDTKNKIFLFIYRGDINEKGI